MIDSVIILLFLPFLVARRIEWQNKCSFSHFIETEFVILYQISSKRQQILSLSLVLSFDGDCCSAFPFYFYCYDFLFWFYYLLNEMVSLNGACVVVLCILLARQNFHFRFQWKTIEAKEKQILDSIQMSSFNLSTKHLLKLTNSQLLRAHIKKQ